MVDFCESYSPFHVCLTQKSTIREIGIICACSDHGQPRYQIWIKCDKRQMTSCVHKMCGRIYGQTNMKRAITLAKINHPWNRYNMCMLISWPTKPYVRPHILCTQLVICLLSHFYSYLVSWLAMIWACTYYTDFTDGWFLRLVAYTRCADGRMVKQTWKGL
jgi:hypothetical protein